MSQREPCSQLKILSKASSYSTLIWPTLEKQSFLIKSIARHYQLREGFNKKNIKSYGNFHQHFTLPPPPSMKKNQFVSTEGGWGGSKIWMENSITFNVFFIETFPKLCEIRTIIKYK